MKGFKGLVTLSALMLAVIFPAAAFAASGPAVLSTETITRGVKLEKWIYPTSAGTAKISVIEIDLQDPYVKVDAVFGKDGKTGNKQSTLNLAKEAGAVAAINGDFFTMTAEGAPFGVTYKSGEMINSPGYISPKNALVIDNNKVPYIERVDFSAQVVAANGSLFQLFGVNKTQYNAGYGGYTGKSHYDRLHLYDSKWNPANWVGDSLGAPYTTVVVKNDQVTQILKNQKVNQIPNDTYVLLAHGAAEVWVNQNIRVGDTLRVNMTVSPNRDIFAAIDGSTLLLKNGQKTPISYEIKGNLARTAVGHSFDKRYLYLVAAEKSASSIGVTLDQLASFLLYKGMSDAVNLDGGGSTTMVARELGKTTYANAVTPQYGTQRAVPNGLAVFSTAPKGKLQKADMSIPKGILAGETVTAKINSAYDEYYNPVAVTSLSVDWDEVDGVNISGSAGTYNLVFEEPGDYNLVYSINDLKESTLKVHVIGRDDIASLSLNPGVVQLKPGEQTRFTATMTLKDGTSKTVPAGLLKWGLEDVEGQITGDGLLTVTGVSEGKVTVSYDGFKTTVPVTVKVAEPPAQPEQPDTPGKPASSVQLKFVIGSKQVLVNEKPQTLDQAPQITNGRTYLPLRAYAELLGAYVEWNIKEQMVEIKYNGQKLNFWVGKPEMTIDGAKSVIDAPPFITESRTMVPLRAAGEAFGMYIDYRKGVQSITVTAK